MDVPFNISARTARLIGMENFANAEGAIIEADKKATDEYKLFNPTQKIDSDFDKEVRGLIDKQ